MKFSVLLMALIIMALSGVTALRFGMRSLSRATSAAFPSRKFIVTPSRNMVIKSTSSDSHQSSKAAPTLSPEDEKIIMTLREHQSTVPRLTYAEEVRTLIEQSIGFGVLSTNSDQFSGYPTGSVVGFSLDEQGMPYFVFSSMSAHTKDISKDGRVSLTVMSKDFKGAAEGRVVLIGNVVKLTDTERIAKLRDGYLARHKDAYWIDFGDFTFFAMDKILGIRFIGGFAMAGSVAPEDYSAAKPDPIAAFAAPVMKHMNDDHSDSVIAMLKHYVGVPCSEAQIISMDSLGMVVKAKLEVAGQGFSKIRLPYPRAVTERKAIKEVLVEMTKASAA